MFQLLCVFEALSPTTIGETSQTHLSLALRKSKSFRNINVFACTKSSSSSSSSTSSSKKKLKKRRADSVQKLFENYGFSQTQFETVISKRPRILHLDAQKILEPKIDFFRSIGLSEEDVVDIITKVPVILARSLEGHLIPTFDLLTTLLGSEQNATCTIKQFPFILNYSVMKNLEPNLSTLRNAGVPESGMFKWGMIKPIVGTPNDWFSKAVGAAISLGFDPCSSTFAHAVSTVALENNQSNWERKLGFYRSLGFSDQETLSMFRKRPQSLALSKEKVRVLVEFYVKRFHWSLSQLSARPDVLLFNFENRIIPRCSVLQILASRGRIHRNVRVLTILKLTEEDFVDKYVNKYKDKEPEVLVAYQGKLIFDEYSFDLGGEPRG